MFDKYFCRKIGKKNISISDIINFILNNPIVYETTVISSFIIAAFIICDVAEYGFVKAMYINAHILLSCGCIAFGIQVIGSFINVASCPLKKQE